MTNYRYHVATYRCDSPVLTMWSANWRTEPTADYQSAKTIYDETSNRLARMDAICVLAQGRRTEAQAMQQHGSSMNAETWECHLKDGTKYWYHLALYVTKAA